MVRIMAMITFHHVAHRLLFLTAVRAMQFYRTINTAIMISRPKPPRDVLGMASQPYPGWKTKLSTISVPMTIRTTNTSLMTMKT